MLRITNYFTPVLIKGLFYVSSLFIIITTVTYSVDSYKSYDNGTDELNYSPGLVRSIQKAVSINSDGIYGDETKVAVEKFQDNHGLTPDGVVGEVTWEEFYRQGQINKATYDTYLLELEFNSELTAKPKKEGSFFNLTNFVLIVLTPIISLLLVRISLEYYYSLFLFLEKKIQTKNNIDTSDTSLSFWSFTKMITPYTLGIVYILGIILSVIFVLLYHESTYMKDLSLLFILMLFICFQIIWRLAIEFYAVFFDFLTGRE